MRKIAVVLLTMVVLFAMATTASARARSADLIMGGGHGAVHARGLK